MREATLERLARGTMLRYMLEQKRYVCTVEDYRSIPEGGPRYELIEGQMIMAPAPSRQHQKISRNLQFLIMRYLEEHPIGAIYNAPFDVELNQFNVFQPDLVYVRAERASVFTDQGVTGAPDLVVEVLSPKTSKYDLGPKREVYARSGVSELWVIDPESRKLSSYYLQQDNQNPAYAISEDAFWESPLFPGLRLSLRQVFEHGL